VKEAEEVVRLVLPTSAEPAEALEPGEESFNFPSTLVSPHSSAVLLATTSTHSSSRGDQLDVALVSQTL
jgi:hypothetical protein